MNENLPIRKNKTGETDAEKRVAKLRKFYKNLVSWASTSIFLLALDIFMNHGITWSKFPVFFFAVALFFQFMGLMRMKYFDKDWEDKMVRKHTERGSLPDADQPETEDYSEELLRGGEQREKEKADLSTFRKLKKPWRDEDLV